MGVLKGYKQERKVFIPPLLQKIRRLDEVSWVKTLIPELVWIALIQMRFGNAHGVAVITSLARQARRNGPTHGSPIFAAASSYEALTEIAQSRLRSELAASGDLFQIQGALTPLVAFYPECPMGFLFSERPSLDDVGGRELEKLKALVARLYDKESRDTILVQATAVWLAFDSGVLRVSSGRALASFPEIENYPNTDTSRKVAASIRAAVPIFLNPRQYPASPKWPTYFWNRGFELDACEFEGTRSE